VGGEGARTSRKEVVRRSACGFANAIGGYLIIGAEHQDSGWAARGVDFLGEEPTVWLSQLIRDGARPIPRHDVKAWPVDGQSVAVVQVEQVAVPVGAETRIRRFRVVVG
jgi:predicted HTH transcriptional regulator